MLLTSLLTTLLLPLLTTAQYTGYTLTTTGSPGSAGSVSYSTANTPATNSSLTLGPPDVYLNASVHVGQISITVANLTAKINLDAQVLNLLQFNAGVDLHIDRVFLLIQNVSAQVALEARLGNLVAMINDTLDALDANPALATLGETVGGVLNETAGAVGGLAGGVVGGATGGSGSPLAARSFELLDNILYSVNDYSGNTHTNRVLAQDGNIVDQMLDNAGDVHSSRVVGSYADTMRFVEERDVVLNGEPVSEREYIYAPFDGLQVIAAVFVTGDGEVVGTRVLSEASGGGSSTIVDV